MIFLRCYDIMYIIPKREKSGGKTTMDKQKLLEVIREEGKQIAGRAIFIGLALITIHFLECYITLLSKGEIIRESLIGGVEWSIWSAVYYFVAILLLKAFTKSNKK